MDDLFQDFLKGNLDAYSKLYKAYIHNMFRYGSNFSCSKEILEDAIHDVFVELYTKRSNLKDVKQVKGYLLISLKNKLLNMHRRDKNIQFVGASYSIEELYPQILTQLTTPISDILKKEQIEKQQKLINYLKVDFTDKENEILYLRYVEELSIKEIAAALNIKEQTARNLLHKAISKMREKAKSIIETGDVNFC